MEMPAVAEVDLAYIAGFIDGEGCIAVDRNALKLTIANTDREVLAWIQSRIGGNLKPMTRYEHQRPCYVLIFHIRPTVRVLQLVLPYLHVKREQALIALLYDEEVQRGGRATGQWRVTDDQIARRERLRLALKEAKRR